MAYRSFIADKHAWWRGAAYGGTAVIGGILLLELGSGTALPEMASCIVIAIPLLILAGVLSFQLYGIANRISDLFCFAILKRGIFQSLCQGRLAHAAIAGIGGFMLALSLLTFLANAGWPVRVALVVDAFLFSFIYARFTEADMSASLTTKSEAIAKPFIATCANYFLLYVCYAVYFVWTTSGNGLEPGGAEIFERVHAEVNCNCRYFEWLTRTSYFFELLIQSLANLGGVLGIVLMAVNVLTISILPFVAVSLLYRHFADLTAPGEHRRSIRNDMAKDFHVRIQYDGKDLVSVLEVYYVDEAGNDRICEDATKACTEIPATCADQGEDLEPWLKKQVKMVLKSARIPYRDIFLERE